MKKFIQIILVVALSFSFSNVYSQTSVKGYDYKSHHRTNKKAQKWGNNRMKASDGDQTNLKCSVRKSRRYARKNRS